MKYLRRVSFWLLLLAVVAAAGWYLTRPQPLTVAAHTVGRGTVESTVANTRAGTVNANRRAKVAPGLGGQVAALLVKRGDRVQKDQVLIELWHKDLDAQLLLAQSEVAKSQALADEALLHAEVAEREARRQEDLMQRDISAASAVDKVVSEARQARAAQLAAITDVEVRKNQVEVIRAQLERALLRAPFPGIVAEVNGELGEFVTPSPVGIPTPPAIDLIDDGALYVTAPIDEVDAAKVRVGMTARVTLDAFGKRPFAGRVRRIAPYVTDREKQARTVDVDVDFAELPKDVQLLPGYSADVEVLLAARADVLRVPAETLREGNKVLLLQADGTLAERTIETGLANWRFIEVKAGLQPGDRIVSSLDKKIVGGARVIVEGDAASTKPDGKL
ncbi:MAG TPA: efflux RND transporter periplasmic adaptor subunit [Planctomycetota bacterium]|nr:efflux RND transporter periplasmic adaptor subunit [Planctomycetota bacterium]